jgi:hypothetical protein
VEPDLVGSAAVVDDVGDVANDATATAAAAANARPRKRRAADELIMPLRQARRP